MSRRERRDGGRDAQPEEQNRGLEQEGQEGESLYALKGILAKVASLLKPLQLSQEESVRLVEQLYGSVLEMDLKLAGETDNLRRSAVLSHISNADIRREKDQLVVEFPKPGGASKPAREAKPAAEAPSEGEPAPEA